MGAQRGGDGAGVGGLAWGDAVVAPRVRTGGAKIEILQARLAVAKMSAPHALARDF